MSGRITSFRRASLSDMMRMEPVVLIDTRDPAVYAEAHISGGCQYARGLHLFSDLDARGPERTPR